MKKSTLLASVSTALLVSIAGAGCATTEAKPAATAEAAKPAEGSCGAEKKAEGSCGADKKAEGSCGAEKKAGEGSCGEGSCGAKPK